MSAYLLDRVHAHPRVFVHLSTEVSKLAGTSALERPSPARTERPSAACSSPVEACSASLVPTRRQPWLHGVTLDPNGFVRTDVQLDPTSLGPTWAALGRAPLPFETNVPAVFAAGDVRPGSTKRVAAAVGEGASLHFVQAAIGIGF
jgi:thioredoxin reductase (NADPH)